MAIIRLWPSFTSKISVTSPGLTASGGLLLVLLVVLVQMPVGIHDLGVHGNI